LPKEAPAEPEKKAPVIKNEPILKVDGKNYQPIKG
jgi:hypothetical protein